MVYPSVQVLYTRSSASLNSVRSVLPPPHFHVKALPTISIEHILYRSDLEDIFRNIAKYDVLVVTSVETVKVIAHYLYTQSIKSAATLGMTVVAVGTTTADALKSIDIGVDVVPDTFNASGIVQLMGLPDSDKLQVLFPRGNKASNKIIEGLSNKGYKVTSPVVYKNTFAHHSENTIHKVLESTDCIALTSPSSLHGLLKNLERHNAMHYLSEMTIAAIGDVTKAACMKAGFQVDILPKKYTAMDMALAIRGFFTDRRIEGG
ncbi:uroporphyrinogen-III synthase [Saccharospirillum salsuginis]|uniref:Uroporphyrinogen-III synthase n=1 Tax=Saccharospirillum salsuginis TaxID=418750 RepID=A0A918K0H9_9GAMM|nr:uroporphyrinogen-III synthase [Saccharospirillum salsuginis]GGX41828.1 uroporphyrinogen-III synthase [Saccharospirillum salsuginis]